MAATTGVALSVYVLLEDVWVVERVYTFSFINFLCTHALDGEELFGRML